MTIRIACIVEGHGEISAVPILLRRIALAIDPGIKLEMPHPLRVPKSKLVLPSELEKAVQLAGAKVAPAGGLLILVDADDDCPAELAPKLLERARTVRCDLPVAVVLPTKEFESWFLAAAESLRDRFRKSGDLMLPSAPEKIGGAKEWLRDKLETGKYSETVDQPALAARFDLNQARNAPSFDKLWREMERMFKALDTSTSAQPSV